MPSRAANALRGFRELVEEMAVGGDELAFPELASRVIEHSGLAGHFAKSRDGKGQDRIENLQELVNAARQFDNPGLDAVSLGPLGDGEGPELTIEFADGELSDLDAFLAHAALEAGEGQAEEWEDCVQLMTLHSAKGLEFPLVFIGGVEEGLFPHSMSSEDPDRLEEERRLCYVGMTRAMRQLYLTHAESRRLHGQETYPLPSRFLREIPGEVVDEVRASPQVSRPYAAGLASGRSIAAEIGYNLGQRVQHPKFGEGVVLNAEGQGAAARVQVNFEAVGAKWLVVAYANLHAV